MAKQDAGAIALRKLDLKRDLKPYFTAARRPALLDVPEFRFLAVDGEGAPESGSFSSAIEGLYAVAYGSRFAAKAELGLDFPVMPLEGLWWSPGDAFDLESRDRWRWQLIVLVPPELPEAFIRGQQERAFARKPVDSIRRVQLVTIREGLSAQVLHLGPYAAETPTIAALHDFIAARSLRPRGPHHEIYLGDPRRAAPEKLRTIIRQPVA